MTLHENTMALLETYNETNSELVDILLVEPTPLQFMRFVAKNRPFVVKGGCLGWAATREWNVSYLEKSMQDAKVEVAETPYG